MLDIPMTVLMGSICVLIQLTTKLGGVEEQVDRLF